MALDPVQYILTLMFVNLLKNHNHVLDVVEWNFVLSKFLRQTEQVVFPKRPKGKIICACLQ